MGTTTSPSIRELDAADTEALLRAHHVGRIAFAWRRRVDIEPIHYVYDDGWIYCRTSEGAKLTTLRHSPWVAFEVDEIEGTYAWRSVVAHGTVHLLHDRGTAARRAAFARAVACLRRIEPAALTPDDPVPWRTVPLGIAVDRLTGREARPEPG